MSRDPEAIRLESAALLGCLMDGDEQQLARMRDRRRKAFAVSFTLQVAIVALVVFLPLLATGQRPLLTTFTPTPRFYGVPRAALPSRPAYTADSHQTSTSHPTFNILSAPVRIPPVIARPDDSPSPACDLCKTGDPTGSHIGPGWPDGIPGLPPSNRATLSLSPVPVAPKPPSLVHRSRMDPAMLIHRVEPEYPVLAKMARREGRVELRAVIGVDGSIESLRVLAGDPLFIEAAKTAVLQWRYRPTTLNGQPVEVDTFVTVIFTLTR